MRIKVEHYISMASIRQMAFDSVIAACVFYNKNIILLYGRIQDLPVAKWLE